MDGVQSVERGSSYRRSDDVGPPKDDDVGGFLQPTDIDQLHLAIVVFYRTTLSQDAR